jgi:hypothetical protein
MTKLIVAFHNFANASRKRFVVESADRITVLMLGSLFYFFPLLIMSGAFYGKPLSSVYELLMEELPQQ